MATGGERPPDPDLAPQLLDAVDAVDVREGLENQRQRAMVEAALFDEPLAPIKIGRFTVVRPVGAGGMGTVYMAYDEQLDRRVAVKLLRGPIGTDDEDDEARRRLQREAQAMARLSHPHVVTVHEVGTFEGQVFVAMEFVPGQDLRRWLRGQPRGWRAVVAVFIEAGEGLAAAHAAGLVHRDFKPDNVLVGDDGRVRVADFGLAHDRGTAPPTIPTLDEQDPERRLTATGAVMGTPAYMAPEQRRGEPVDARADQFAFCVALFEGLCGRRPFAEDPTQVGWPRQSDVPTWLRQLVTRGLSTDPSQRFDSMRALLSELERDRVRRWRQLGIVGLTLLAGSAGVLLTRSMTEEPAAPAPSGPQLAQQRLDERWGADAKERGRRAFSSLKSRYAAEAWPVVERHVDAWAARWHRQYVDAWEATHVFGVQTDQTLERRMLCLDARLAELGAVLEIFAEADEPTVRRAVQIIERLTPLDQCADVDALKATAPLPSDRKTRATIEQIERERLPSVVAATIAGRHDEALSAAEALLPEVRPLGYGPTTARVLLRLGSIRVKHSDFDLAEQHLLDAMWEAEASGTDVVTLDAVLELLNLVIARKGGYEPVQAWTRRATALIERLGDQPAHRARLEGVLGAIAYRRGHNREARAHLEDALAHSESDPDAFHVVLRVGWLNVLAVITEHLDDYDAAFDAHDRQMALIAEALGPHHPRLGIALLNRGNLLSRVGRNEDAIEALDQSRPILEDVYGDEHPFVASLCFVQGNVLTDLGRLGEATESLERSLAIRTQRLGEDHQDVAATLLSLGRVHMAQHQHQRAHALTQRAYEIYRRTLDPAHPSLGIGLSALGELLVRLDRPDEALEQLRQARAIFDSRSPDTAMMRRTTMWIGRAHLARGDMDAAIAALEDALVLCDSSDTGRIGAGRVKMSLAQALWSDSRTRPRARTLAREAQQALTSTGPLVSEEAAQLAAWRRDILGETP